MVKSTVSVFGAGSWGTALAVRLAANQHTVILWGRDESLLNEIKQTHQNPVYLPNVTLPSTIRPQSDLASAVAACEYVVLSVPAGNTRHILEQIRPELSSQHRGIICTSKGFEKETQLTMPQLIEAVAPDLPSAYLSGPSFATEVARGMPTAITMASNDAEFANAAATLFHSDVFRVYCSADVAGVTLVGTLKNVIAIATGIADGLEYGMNTRAALIARGLNEIRTFARVFQAQDETIYGLAGLGDLVLTCTDNQSRNRRMGLALAQGKTIAEIEKDLNQAIEGINTAAVIHELASQKQIEMPICEQVYRILNGQTSPRQAVQELLNRPPKREYAAS